MSAAVPAHMLDPICDMVVIVGEAREQVAGPASARSWKARRVRNAGSHEPYLVRPLYDGQS